MIEKRVKIGDFLTDDEIKAATKLYETIGIKNFAAACAEQIIKPNIERINKALGQENNPLFLAYAVEYVLLMVEKRGKSTRKVWKQKQVDDPSWG